MKKILFLLLLLTLPAVSSAEFISGRTTHKTFGSGDIYFGVDSAPTDTTCNFWSRHFRFDATTEGGENMLTILLTSIVADKKIDIWYTPSSQPGTNHTQGCNGNKVAEMTKVALH